MKTIIAGGRDHYLSENERRYLFSLIDEITEVVSGVARGADESGEYWAQVHNIPVKRFYANWKKYGKAAGPKRNEKMAEYADALIAFPGGKGTADMIRRAEKHGLKIWKRGDQ